jgi:hypothetical protein
MIDLYRFINDGDLELCNPEVEPTRTEDFEASFIRE